MNDYGTPFGRNFKICAVRRSLIFHYSSFIINHSLLIIHQKSALRLFKFRSFGNNDFQTVFLYGNFGCA